jgi:Asp-tRNA(Asn)/Glu-tRNA(Gln) amidotransferase A subunit family amidase
MAAVHVHHAIANRDEDDDDSGKNPMEQMSEMFGPGHVDTAVRQAIQACWMALPKDRRNIEEVEKEIRRLVDRALMNLREDTVSFGKP